MKTKNINSLSDVDGVHVGHWTDPAARTGCSVVMFDQPAVVSVHVAGGAPGSQETDLLASSRIGAKVDAILLTGGSAYGLAAASGVRRYLEEEGRGFKAGDSVVPIVPAAVIFDLATGGGDVRPGPDEGYAACINAQGEPKDEGLIGAGAGATVGKYMGHDRCHDGGLATYGATVDDGVTIGAIMVANCYGAVIDRDDRQKFAGPVDDDGMPARYLENKIAPPDFGSTAIGVVVTDAGLTKSDAERVAVMAHDGIARAVYPSHTPYDGDMIFVASVGSKKMEVSRVGAWSAHMVERAIVSAVFQ